MEFMMRKHFSGYNFLADPKTGVTFRWGDSFNEDPYMAPWPELVDISISNYCTNDCEYCYRQSSETGSFMSVEDFQTCLEQLSNPKFGGVFQIALGGGEPLLHPDVSRMLRLAKEHNIVPNYTTSGKFFTTENLKTTRECCGAIAVSWDPTRNLTLNELKDLGKLLKVNHIASNIHFVVSNSTIGTAIKILKGDLDEYLVNFNSVIFLTYKPTGRASKSDIIQQSPDLKEFLRFVDESPTDLKIGFDACFIPVLIKHTAIDTDFVDSCECGFFSLYIDEKLNVSPCSFCNDESYSYNLNEISIEDIWQEKLSDYREFVAENTKDSCADCDKNSECRGRCPFFEELFLCYDTEKSY
jgi:radical SAM protein with 4Fe4S-binding SPASM domain